jgi:hypothetical protein
MSLDVTSIDTIEKANRNQWNHVVDQSEVGTVYHRYGWLRAIEYGTPHTPRHLLVSKKNNPIAIFPNFLVAAQGMPFHHLTSIARGPGGPIAITEEETAVQLLLEEVSDVSDGTVISNQIRTRGQEFTRYHGMLEENGYEQKLTDCDFELDISRDWEDILADMDSSRRRAIGQGHENEFEIVDEAITDETMSAFYDGFVAVMERVGGDPPPRQFFLELTAFDDRVKVFSLRSDGRKRGSILVLLNDEQNTIRYQESAVETDHFEYNASELLHEHAIKWGRENGYDTYDFGGTNLDFRDGLFRFKEQFGARPVPALVWERGCSIPAWPAYRLGRYVYQRLQT